LKRSEAGDKSRKNRKEVQAVLTPDELERLDRQVMIRQFGKEGQERLKKARIVVAGAAKAAELK